MTHPSIKKQITAQYLSIGGIGYINHAHLLEVFGIKPQEISKALEVLIESIKQEQGCRFVPPVCTLSELSH